METVQQIADRFGVTKQAVYRWIRHGLAYKKERVIGRKERKVIDPANVVTFLRLTEQVGDKDGGN